LYHAQAKGRALQLTWLLVAPNVSTFGDSAGSMWLQLGMVLITRHGFMHWDVFSSVYETVCMRIYVLSVFPLHLLVTTCEPLSHNKSEVLVELGTVPWSVPHDSNISVLQYNLIGFNYHGMMWQSMLLVPIVFL